MPSPEATLTTGPALRDRLRELFDAAADLPRAERDPWLEAHVPDATERTALRRLLSAVDAHGFLDTSATEHAARLAAEEMPRDALIGQRVGAFRIVRALGQGGMAAVFLGERADVDFTQQ